MGAARLAALRRVCRAGSSWRWVFKSTALHRRRVGDRFDDREQGFAGQAALAAVGRRPAFAPAFLEVLGVQRKYACEREQQRDPSHRRHLPVVCGWDKDGAYRRTMEWSEEGRGGKERGIRG